MSPSHGAYGFRVLGLEGLEELLVPAERDWPALTVTWTVDSALAPDAGRADGTSTVTFTAAGAVLDLGAAARIEIDRDPPAATIRTRAQSSPAAIVHPYLGGAASVLARWHGREALHGGAAVVGGSAWGILGGREAGKSSLLAWLHLGGLPVVADDVLLVEDGDVFAAPRSLDLREATHVHLGVGEPLGTVGARERWRVRLGGAPGRAPLGGWVFLEWADRLELAPIRGAERLARLAAQLTTPELPSDPDGLLELAALPAFALRRPQDWSSLDAAGRVLLEGLGG